MGKSSGSAGSRNEFQVRPLVTMVLAVGLCGSSPLAHAEKNPLRDVFFGETHIHTSWSFDAYVFGNTLTGPEDAYQYALGKPIRHPAGYMVQMKRPLDFRGRDGSFGIHGHGPARQRSTVGLEQAADRREAEGQEQGGYPEGLPLPRHVHHHERADQGAGQPRGRRLCLEERRRHRRQVLPAGQVHDLRRVRMELDAGQSQPAPQHHLQGLEEGSGVAVYRDRLGPSGGPVELDGWPAQGGQRAAGDLAQREPLRWRHVSAGSRQQGPADRRRVGAIAGEQRAAVRDPAAQGRIGNAPGAVAQRRVRRARDSGVSAGRRRSGAQAARQLHPRGVPERPGDAGNARLQPVQVRPRRRERHARHRDVVYAIELSSAAMACSTPRRRADSAARSMPG